MYDVSISYYASLLVLPNLSYHKLIACMSFNYDGKRPVQAADHTVGSSSSIHPQRFSVPVECIACFLIRANSIAVYCRTKMIRPDGAAGRDQRTELAFEDGDLRMLILAREHASHVVYSMKSEMYDL